MCGLLGYGWNCPYNHYRGSLEFTEDDDDFFASLWDMDDDEEENDEEEEQVSRRRRVSHGDEIDLDSIQDLEDDEEEEDDDDTQSGDASGSKAGVKKADRQNMLVYEITLDELLELVD